MDTGLHESIVAAARQLNSSGINTGTSGNVSARTPAGMLITPSGMPYDTLRPAALVEVAADGSWAPDQRPSSEWRFHRDIYRAFPTAQAIVHAHPVHCAALSCLRRPIPAFHYMVAVAGGTDIRCAAYATFGSQELSDNVVDALQDRTACLLANHGLVCHARSPGAALTLAIEVENLARTYCLALTLGEPTVLGDAEMERVLVRFRDYGPSPNLRTGE